MCGDVCPTWVRMRAGLDWGMIAGCETRRPDNAAPIGVQKTWGRYLSDMGWNESGTGLWNVCGKRDPEDIAAPPGVKQTR